VKATSKTAVVIFVVVLILVAVGFYYVVAIRNSDNQPKDAKSNQTGNTPTVEVPPSTDVSKPVEEAYTAYLKGVKEDRQEEALAAFKKASSDTLAAKLSESSDKDPILCSNNIPQKLTFSDPPLMGGITVVSVTAVFENSNVVISVTSDVNTKKITSIDCPTGKSAAKLAPTQ